MASGQAVNMRGVGAREEEWWERGTWVRRRGGLTYCEDIAKNSHGQVNLHGSKSFRMGIECALLWYGYL